MAAVEPPAAMRVVLPTAEQPPVQLTPVAPAEKTALVTPTSQIPPQVTLAKTDDEQRVVETSKQNELAWRKKSALAAERAAQRKAKEAAIKRRQQYAQQIARRELARAKQQQDLQSDTNRRESGLLAFGTDDQPAASGFFGN